MPAETIQETFNTGFQGHIGQISFLAGFKNYLHQKLTSLVKNFCTAWKIYSDLEVAKVFLFLNIPWNFKSVMSQFSTETGSFFG